jgi:FolB domain-containing protein
MDQIFINDIIARGIIGITEAERKKPQDIWINITIFTDIRKAGESDDLADSIDYRTIAKSVIVCAESANRMTVEALATDLANLCLQNEGVEKVRIKVEKPGAVRFSRSVGVEIERSKI